jgi:hypothetical protein
MKNKNKNKNKEKSNTLGDHGGRSHSEKEGCKKENEMDRRRHFAWD